ncbi:helix-turn-helix domain-containing protein [Cohnella suwonensis]|uniref:Helix-turn-helix domain-containing protein n=1 Tax=Cohnella suwonensis TaxID=696072 RepID=A0ABW0M101_9BACL
MLLVDDEDIDLEGLKRLIDWKSLQMEVVSAVNSGFAALEVIRKEAVDLLVTDIKMPMMSGLELMSKALEHLPELKTVLVSGYEDFHYAKQAIQMNAYGYILKPIDDDEIYRVLAGIKAEMDRMRMKKAEELALESSIPLVRNELLLRVVEGNASDSVKAGLLERAKLDWSSRDMCIAVLEMDDISWKLNRYHESERNDKLEKLNEFIIDWCNESGIVVCKSEAHRMILFVCIENHLGLFEPLIASISDKFPLTVTIGVGPVIRAVGDMRRSYMAASEALNLKMFLGKSRIILHSVTKTDFSRSAKDLDDILSEMFAAMTQYELIRIDDCIQELFVLVKNLNSRLSIYNFSLHVISRLDVHMRVLNENLYKLLGIEMKDLDILFHFETIEDIKSWLRRRLFELSELLYLKKQKKNRKLVEEIDQYVSRNLHHNITLRDAANHFSFSPNHLGHLFKDGTGMNFSDYVIQARLQRARELLRVPTVKIYEVAGQVGYKNLTYFSKQFRETFGMTPGDYRKQC